jgi:hypothetical protein
VTERRKLPPKEARKLLALAGIVLVARTKRERELVTISIEGPEVTDETIRAGVHRLLDDQRRALGTEIVDLSSLVEHGEDFDW